MDGHGHGYGGHCGHHYGWAEADAEDALAVSVLGYRKLQEMEAAMRAGALGPEAKAWYEARDRARTAAAAAARAEWAAWWRQWSWAFLVGPLLGLLILALAGLGR